MIYASYLDIPPKLMSLSQIIFKVISYILLSLAFLGIFLLLTTYLRNQAINDCAKISKYTKQVIEDSATVEYPVNDFYTQCLKDKGIR